jgi:hypothetical protein
MRLFRFTYAAYIGARILLGYKLLAMRKQGLGEEKYKQKFQRHHLNSAQRIYRGVLRMQGLMIKIGRRWAAVPTCCRRSTPAF